MCRPEADPKDNPGDSLEGGEWELGELASILGVCFKGDGKARIFLRPLKLGQNDELENEIGNVNYIKLGQNLR